MIKEILLYFQILRKKTRITQTIKKEVFSHGQNYK